MHPFMCEAVTQLSCAFVDTYALSTCNSIICHQQIRNVFWNSSVMKDFSKNSTLKVGLVLSGWFTHWSNRPWPRAPRNSFLWRLILTKILRNCAEAQLHNLLRNDGKCKCLKQGPANSFWHHPKKIVLNSRDTNISWAFNFVENPL